MEEILAASYAADAALIAVKLLLANVIIKHATFQTHPLPKGYPTTATVFGYWLSAVTEGADHLPD